MDAKKYPKTWHVPWSQSNSSDDHWHIEPFTIFNDKEIVLKEKLDGENTNFYSNHIHARSVHKSYHPSQTWVKNLHGSIKHLIPKDIIICGENLYAFHSIFYTQLPTYFFVFNIWKEDICLSWDETVEYCEILNLQTVPVLYRGIWNEQKIKTIWEDWKNSKDRFPTFENEKQQKMTDPEGYVIRATNSFPRADFSQNLAKFVRANHVQTDTHWMEKPVIPNLLKNL